MTDPFDTIPARALGEVVGGWEAHTSGSILNGFGFSGSVDRRGDNEYRREIVEQGCRQKYTSPTGAIDTPKVGQCMLDRLDPPTRR
ncbi:MAG TPA: hypothetical protein VGG28_16395 [Kofleriaceae bacterium]|jgi:hypothetical protein